ncbi:hypothetical protein PQX77_007395 [Marasmius sp. AFHP31]|nr:hypothetical protein PQX77_007395 [Marasmius sp. AFHP31]
MSTHNVDNGTGGLDASLAYKLDRAQSLNPDIIAMGAVLRAAACGGPLIPYRGGRVDAIAAGPPTVPEPPRTWLRIRSLSVNRASLD